ncbi:PilZ domain-containing protein [Brevibacillus sp. LEMMJ03]|uniref:PilZ domain-containing protein n=1 Tax=Brevibacillus sp. LEMMJ03 TaxID=2595056 RepID=UPI00118038A4|nr:PilZ domain-containing protein [Brevibacillus sp. LEMMJ03]TRY26386.1 PilZ domain-containing protein [Brevibacillus sp. LEMMJ03]
MADVPSLTPFIADKRLQRGGAVELVAPAAAKQPLDAIVEHVHSGYLILSYVQGDAAVSLLGTVVRLRLETDEAITWLSLQVVQEQAVWPVKLARLVPVGIEQEAKGERPLLQPDFVINVPYKIMGARPMEENGEGVLLRFSPTHLIVGTDGFVSVGDFLHLSFLLPHYKQEPVAMTKVVEKTFQDGSTVLKLVITDMEEKHRHVLQSYYEKLAQSAPR